MTLRYRNAIRTVFASFTLLAVLSAPALAGVNLPALDPNYVIGLASIDSDTEARVKFDNQTSFSINVYWIDYSGAEVFYASLGSGSFYVQGTYMTHPWLIRRSDNLNPIVGFLPFTGGPALDDFDIATITEQPIPVKAQTWSAIKTFVRH